MTLNKKISRCFLFLLFLIIYPKIKGAETIYLYKEIRDNPNNCDHKSIRSELFKYCRLDTYAMYAIFKELQNL